MISVLPRMTAVCRDRMAVGTKCRLMARICSPKPGISRSATASVASGVTSRGVGPVPPVVRIRLQPSASASSRRVLLMSSSSSGTSRLQPSHGEARAESSHSARAGMPLSSYVPLLARSEMETRPIRSGAVSCISVDMARFLGV